jgi:hypothetical protein
MRCWCWYKSTVLRILIYIANSILHDIANTCRYGFVLSTHRVNFLVLRNNPSLLQSSVKADICESYTILMNALFVNKKERNM